MYEGIWDLSVNSRNRFLNELVSRTISDLLYWLFWNFDLYNTRLYRVKKIETRVEIHLLRYFHHWYFDEKSCFLVHTFSNFAIMFECIILHLQLILAVNVKHYHVWSSEQLKLSKICHKQITSCLLLTNKMPIFEFGIVSSIFLLLVVWFVFTYVVGIDFYTFDK